MSTEAQALVKKVRDGIAQAAQEIDQLRAKLEARWPAVNRVMRDGWKDNVEDAEIVGMLMRHSWLTINRQSFAEDIETLNRIA